MTTIKNHRVIYEKILQQDEEGAYEAVLHHLEVAEETWELVVINSELQQVGRN